MKTRMVTIMIDDDLFRKLKQIQGQKIKETNSSVSLSEVVRECLKSGLKK